MPPKRLGGDTAMHGRVGGLVRGKKLRKGACDLLGRVKNVGPFRELDNTMQIRLEKPKASRSKKAVKRGRAGADKDVTQAAIQTMLATKDAQRARALAPAPKSPTKSPMKKKPRSITAGPAAALGTAARGAKLVVEARGAYNATSKRYDFDGELGAPHSICEVGQLIHDGKLKISKLQKDKSYGIPYATMARWAMDDKKWREKQNLSGGVEGKPRWYVEKHSRARKTLDSAGAPTLLAKPARAAIVHAVCDAKRNGCPFQPKEVKAIIREACIATGKINPSTKERYYETTRVDGQLNSICGAAKRDYDVTLENQKGQGHARERVDACDYEALTKNVELVAPLLRAFQEQYGKIPLDNVGNYDETFLDLCAYASTGAYLVPSDDVAVQVLIPFEKSPHITLLIFTLGGKLLRILVGIIGTTDIAPHPFHLSLVKDKTRIGLFQTDNGWITHRTKYEGLKVYFADDNVLGNSPCCLNFDGHKSNTDKVPGTLEDEAVPILLRENQTFGHTPLAHSTAIGTQQADLPQGIIQRAKAKFADLMRSQVRGSLKKRGKYKGRVSTATVLRLIEQAFFESGVDDPAKIMDDHKRVGYWVEEGWLMWDPRQTMNRAKLDFGNALGKGDAAEADAGERSAGAQNLDRAMEMARADVEAVGGAVHKAYTPPVDLDEAAAVHVPRRTREDRAQYGLVVTDDDYVKAISSEGARALAERAAEAAKASKVSERWEKRRAEIRAVEKQVADGAPLENLKVGQLKSLIYGRTGSGAKASNNKEGAMLAEARVALGRDLMLPPTPTRRGAEDSADAAGDGSDGELEDGADDP
ncbi:hypothetical protein SO694_00028235 [Aureococcus anophagefferens]|uniref:DDE-1 domain-containing protein n=1 Tax=Aureococcus anophagefferens TaxID=44056 RepID=A0ABR1FVI1_AURAN